MRIRPYALADRPHWDDWIRGARNGHFLYERDYIEHHADRFPDASWIFEDDEGSWVGCVPGTRRDQEWSSHSGLTFGGLVVRAPGGAAVLEMFRLLDTRLFQEGVRRAIWRPQPWFYRFFAAEDELYALFRLGATLEGRTLSVIQPAGEAPDMHRQRRRGVARARAHGIVCSPGVEENAWSDFWPLVEERLGIRHGVRPIHDLPTILRLARLFPQGIRLFVARSTRNDVLAGSVVYTTATTWHIQYLHASEEGRETRAIDLLVSDLASRAALEGARFLEWGHSCEQGGRILNEGLLAYKESFGGSGAVYDTWAWTPGERSIS